jgi:para-aminobenzoate synthetase component 1
MGFEKLNKLGGAGVPFLFIADFKGLHVEVFELDRLESEDIKYTIDEDYKVKDYKQNLIKNPIEFAKYKEKFDFVIEKIKSGETYLLNLTAPTKIEIECSLDEIFQKANAHYKLRYKDEFVCFSPEKFVQIKDNKINTYPMKGTIDASINGAKEKILADKKEMAEHIMVVDLLRNDLSIVAKDVRVEKFRYITKIEAGDKELFHVSSHISGSLDNDWKSKIGDILKSLLPAGSISGTPKKSTLDIIEKIEGYKRGYFSGVFGVFDGESLDSGVMIRFIQKTGEGFVYKSGGGLTLDSECLSEYNELLDKVYLP